MDRATNSDDGNGSSNSGLNDNSGGYGIGDDDSAGLASGGLITGGSGFRDDILLGMAGNTAIYGMGGEYVVNKKATAAYLPLLEQSTVKVLILVV